MFEGKIQDNVRLHPSAKAQGFLAPESDKSNFSRRQKWGQCICRRFYK